MNKVAAEWMKAVKDLKVAEQTESNAKERVRSLKSLCETLSKSLMNRVGANIPIKTYLVDGHVIIVNWDKGVTLSKPEPTHE